MRWARAQPGAAAIVAGHARLRAYRLARAPAATIDELFKKIEKTMTMSYPQMKVHAINLLDVRRKGLLSNYGPGAEYNANTRLDSINVTAPVRAVIITTVNDVLRKAVGSDWRDVRPVETVKCTTIGDFVKLVCNQAGIAMPDGEPR